ncbi:virulence factor TspB C-terminal domain-related protein [Aeromonas sp. HMWF015]|uniref:virulence factor TspB C-terminal domain-related protein n=1 Tax=Aeromonas sp. HMWF015 TaxID=2056851 RepID=UPI0015E822AE|nr:virulence factor TspB C-terminal domain-related protein [Aeromonas sp. HMWF015]
MRLLKSFILLLLILPVLASAAYTTMTLEGVKQANGVWTASGVMDSMGFVRTTGAVTVSGTTASTAVSLAVERNIAKNTFRGVVNKLGPYGIAAAGAYEVYDWLSNGDGTQPQLVPCDPTSPIWCHPADSSGYDDTYQYGTYYEACNGMMKCNRGSTAREACDNLISGDGVKISSITINPNRCNLSWIHNGMPNGHVSYGKNSCTPLVSVASCKFEIDPNKPKPTPIPGDYFNSYPDPSLPVMADGFNNIPSLRDGGIPISSTKFNPYSEWLGDPYFKDGQWWRDRMDVSPSPQPGQPNRVRVDIGPVKIEGATNPETVPDTGPAGGSGGAPQPEKEKPTFCEANPMSIACVELGQLEDKPLEVVELPVNVTYTPWGASNAQCPAPTTIPLWGGDSISVTYQPVCDFVTKLRPLIIALAFFIAGLIITGYNFKKGGE